MTTRHDFELDSAAVLFEYDDQNQAMVILDREDGDTYFRLDEILGQPKAVLSVTPYIRAPYVVRNEGDREELEQRNAMYESLVARHPNPTVYRVRITATVEALSPEESAAAIKAARDREIRLEAEWYESMTKGGE